MAITQLPAPCKIEREANGHFYIWDGTFRPEALYDLNDPPLGLGAALNALFGQFVPAVVVSAANDSHFQVFQNFLLGS